jgi:hypothetical protein
MVEGEFKMPAPKKASPRARAPLQADVRADGRRKRRPPLEPLQRTSIDAGAAYAFGDGRSGGVLAGRKETTRKLYQRVQ